MRFTTVLGQPKTNEQWWQNFKLYSDNDFDQNTWFTSRRNAQVHERVAKLPFQDMCWGYSK